MILRAARYLVFSLAIVPFCAPAFGDEPAAAQVDFTRDVRPILSDRCYFCHGPDAERREAGLRLDTAEGAHEWAIVPGKPDESEVVSRVFSTDAELMMPPPSSKIKLTQREKSILRAWIAQGAEYDDHWAFVPLGKGVGQGSAKDDLDLTNQIDLLIARNLELAGLQVAERADPVTLLRRLYLDLTGMPPSLEDADQYLMEDSPDRYERLVDRLLESERYGERMAVDWLDVSRYADTYGYQNDRFRPMWPWRDWVVRAFNDNLPYDQFITWQIAGDLFPNATRDQILATAFNRNHRQTNEGGSVEEEFRAEYVADRVNTFGAAFLGLTLECCRCHDHKYDPISQREYYQLSAFFNNIDESGLYSHFTQAVPTPTLSLSDAQVERQLAELHEKVRQKESELSHVSVDQQEFQSWRDSLADVRPHSLQPRSPQTQGTASLRTQLREARAADMLGDFPFESISDRQFVNRAGADVPAKTSENPKVHAGRVGKGLLLSGDNNVNTKAGGDFTRHQRFTVSLWIRPEERHQRAVIFHRSRAWTDSASRGYELLIEDGKLSAALVHFWPGNAIRIQAKEELPIQQWSHVAVAYDGSSRASGLNIYVDGNPIATKVIRDKLTKHIKGSDGFSGGDSSTLTIGQRFRDVGFKNGQVDELKVMQRNLTDLEVKVLYVEDAFPENLAEVLHNASELQLEEFFLSQRDSYVALNAELQALREEQAAIGDAVPEIMVMQEREGRRPTYVLNRGAYDSPGEEVTASTLKKIFPKQYDSIPTRRELADWLVDREHPLTARVAVNRFWQMLFGAGLVSTSEDFGLQGSLPSHPELLDRLALHFIESGWDVKALLKSIVMSETYRRRSDPTPQLLEVDPENRFLARGASHRLPAEMIRDSALMASGLLVERLGGPPTKPYQPDGLWKEKSGQVYRRDSGEGSRRRSLYTYWKRTSPPPAMMTLDASNREVCVVRRQVTMTPLQMLVLLNDPQFVEAAKALAEKAMLTHERLEDQLTLVFRSLITRQPDAGELAVLKRMYSEQKTYFEKDESSATELLTIGDHICNPDLEIAGLAALTVVAEGLMSFDETVMKR